MSIGRTFGRIVRSRRLSLGMTQEEVAYILGTDQSWVSQIEAGRIKSLPAPDRFAEICRALKLPQRTVLMELGYLSDEEDEKTYQDDEFVVLTNLAAEAGHISDDTHREMLLSTIGFIQRLRERGGDPDTKSSGT